MKALRLFALFWFIIPIAFAQTQKAIEGDLLKSFKRIDYCIEQRFKDTSFDWTANLYKANKDIGDRLKWYAEKNPAIITYPFTQLKKAGLNISTSDDGLFRIYSWDTQTGGTMHFFENIFQYKIAAKSFSILDTPKGEGDNRPNFYKLYTFKPNGQTYYLAVSASIGSSRDLGDGLDIFKLNDGKLVNARIIKTATGINSELSYSYDRSLSGNLNADADINFYPKTQTLQLPLIDAQGKLTNKFITYKFTGQYFERVK